jgi:phenylalanyl-tRNA synthetase beta chain
MKVTLNWLKQYVDFDWSPQELSERLTMLGLEVEGVQKLAGAFEGVVVAQVLTRDKHPNADKLSLCRVQDGKGERQIVCGAQNFKAGDKVPLILPGASLPARPGEKEPFTIKVGKIRGVESHGMMCSHEELGLDPETIGLKKEEGLLLLREDAVVGQPFAEYLGLPGSDVVYDLEVTPNRPDLNSVIGIAREIAAVTGHALRLPEATCAESGPPAAAQVAVRIEAPDLGLRYSARVIRGVRVGPSPDWLRSMLEKVGLRSINNVVDVTNYVMLESGQPLHAFDYHLIAPGKEAPPTLVVRRASDGEKFTTLDGQERALGGDMLLIADESRGIAIAGVMGGRNTEINERTVDVLLESACFHPSNIRRTSKALGLRTDASYRFERGADIGITDWASRRAARLIVETAGGELAPGCVDAYPEPRVPKHIVLRHAKVNQLLGLELAPGEIEYFLGQLGLKLTGRKPQPLGAETAPEPATFQVPSWRVDLKREADLVEEVARLYGVDRIPATPPLGGLGSNPFDGVHDQIAEARRILATLGLSEAQGQTLVSRSDVRGVPAEEVVPLSNPLSSDMDVLRPSLLPGLVRVLQHNISRKNPDVALFEVGRVFLRGVPAAGAAQGKPSPAGALREERRIAVALTGARDPLFWAGSDREAKLDASDMKGVLEQFLEQFGLRGVGYARREGATSLFLESAAILIGGRLSLGEVGLLSPLIAREYDLRDPVWLAELNLDLLVGKRNALRAFKALPAFPTIRRDVAMIVPETTTHEAVLAVVKQAKPANLEAVELFDVFRGKHVPEGQKSLAYAFTYRAGDRTLTDAEVNLSHERVVGAFKQQLQATVRGE